MTNYEVLKQPGMLAAFFNNKFNGFPCGWCGMRSFEECDCVDRSTGCGFDWDEKFKTTNRYSLNRMAKEIGRAISGACDICPVMDTCLEDGDCVDTITEWLVQDNFMYDICMSKSGKACCWHESATRDPAVRSKTFPHGWRTSFLSVMRSKDGGGA